MKKFIEGFKEGMHDFSTNLSIIVNSILLLIVYIFGVGLTFILSKIIGKKFIDTKPEKVNSYWENLNLKNQKKEECFRQF